MDKPLVDIYATTLPGADDSAAYGLILCLGTRHRKDFSGWQAEGGLSRAVLLAVADGLERLTRPCQVRFITDIPTIANLLANFSEMEQELLQGRGTLTDETEEKIRNMVQVHEVQHVLVKSNVERIQEARDLAMQASLQGASLTKFLLGEPSCLDPEPKLNGQNVSHTSQPIALWGQRRRSA